MATHYAVPTFGITMAIQRTVPDHEGILKRGKSHEEEIGEHWACSFKLELGKW